MSKTFVHHNPKEIKKCGRGIVVFKDPKGRTNWTAAYYNEEKGFWVAEDDNNYTGTVTDVYLYEEEPNIPVSSGNDPFAEVFSPIEWI